MILPGRSTTDSLLQHSEQHSLGHVAIAATAPALAPAHGLPEEMMMIVDKSGHP